MGPFYFAWVNANETVFADEHIRLDEDVFSFSVTHGENAFAVLNVEIKNPNVGLLCATRKQWAWLSYDADSFTVPLFFGRLIGVPSDINKTIISLTFMAQPLNYNILKEVLANSLKYAPYWDPVFIDPNSRGNPDVVLEARPALWAIDRITGDVSISNIITGEDGTEDLTADEIIVDSVSVQLDGKPLRAVTIIADVGWTQIATGSVTLYNGYVVNTYTADGLVNDWPKPGASLSGGWKSTISSAIAVPDYAKDYNPDRWNFFGTPPSIVIFNSEVEPPSAKQTLADTITTTNLDYPGETLFDFQANHKGRPIELNLGNATLNVPRIPKDWLQIKLFDGPFLYASWDERVLIPMWHAKVNLTLGYDAKRIRGERLTFTMHADVQPIITLATEAESPIISLSGTNVDEAVDAYAPLDIPIRNPARSSYFPTDRGLESIEYLLSLARARLLMGARAVKVSCNIPFNRAIEMTMRKSATINDASLPGGTATGKIVNYSFWCTGDTGEALGSVTIACSIGRNTTLSPIAGEADYVDDDCLDPDIQEYIGEVILLDGSDVGYSVPTDAPNDDGLILTSPLTRNAVIISETTTGSAAVQKQAVLGPFAHYTYAWNSFGGQDTAPIKLQVKAILDKYPTTISLQLKPLDNGPFLSEYNPYITNLAILRGINLEICS